MNTKVYVGNLPYEVTESELKTHFEAKGGVSDVHIVTDRETGQARGFAFVTMEDVAGMQSVIEELDGVELSGRPLKINEARPREDRNSGGGGYSGGGGGGGYKGNNQRKSGGGSRKGQSKNQW